MQQSAVLQETALSDEYKLMVVHRSQQGLNQHPGTRQTDITHCMPAV